MTPGRRRPAAPERRAAAPATLALAVVATALTLNVLVAAPARAHGPTPDASNFRSTVLHTARMVDGRPGDPVRTPGITWRVLGADALLEVHNTGPREVVVLGYGGEPFLRVGPDGVFENRRSPATYLNADRFARTAVPAEADVDAEPQWRQISDTPRWRWHDHRIHWMADTDPPAVARAPDRVHRVLDWYVPFRSAGRELAVVGELVWIPAGPAWPWLLGAVALTSLPLLVPVVRRRRRGVVRVLATMITAISVACVAAAVGDVVATPASVAADVWAVVQSAVPVVIAVALAVSAWRRAPAADPVGVDLDADAADLDETMTTLLLATAILAIGCGVVRFAELRASQIVTVLEPWMVRATVAASLGLVVSAALAKLLTRRWAG